MKDCLILSVLLALAIAIPGMVIAKTNETNTENFEYESLDGKSVQVHDTEVIKAAPLEKPLSSKMRQKRQQMEMETEEKFIQKLEEARMQDERTRREQIYEQELRASLADEPISQSNEVNTTASVEDYEDDRYNYYVTLAGGGVNYPLVNNVPNLNGAANLALGVGVGSDFWLEGSFLFSFQESEIQSLTGVDNEDIDHMSFGGAVKYNFGFSNHWVTPIVGALLTYTRRRYNGGDNNSSALDGGVVGGLEIALNNAVKIGAEGRYMTNFDYARDFTTDTSSQKSATGVKPKDIETFDYAVYLLTAKMLF